MKKSRQKPVGSRKKPQKKPIARNDFQSTNWSKLTKWVGIAATVAAGVAGALQFFSWAYTTIQDYSPNISVTEQPTQFPSRSLGMEFRVKNNGKTELTNLKFTCTVDELGDGRFVGAFENNFPGQEPLPSLKPGQEVTRNCGTFFARVVVKKLVFKVTYEAFGRRTEQAFEKTFTVELGERGFYAKPTD